MDQLTTEGYRLDFSNDGVRLPSVTIGKNGLDTSFQFRISDEKRRLFMVVKIYDKIADLVAREGTHPIGSRINEVIGCKRKLDKFNRRLRAS
jgi:hypothetical protein